MSYIILDDSSSGLLEYIEPYVPTVGDIIITEPVTNNIILTEIKPESVEYIEITNIAVGCKDGSGNMVVVSKFNPFLM
jgi:hypothetical protein